MRELVAEDAKVLEAEEGEGRGGEGERRVGDLPEYFEGDIGGYQKPI